MKKKANKAKFNKKNLIALIVLLLFCLILFLLGYGVGRIAKSLAGYKIDSRIEKLEKFQKEKGYADAVAWLKVQGTNIDYPIISTDDQSLFQNDDIQYLWKVGDLHKLNRVNIVLGHNILNLSSNPLIADKNHKRFEQLMSFTYLDFVKDNQYIQFTIDGKDYLFKIFAVSYLDTGDFSTYNSESNGNATVKSIIDSAEKNSIFEFDIDVDEKDTILSLVTCTRMFGAFDRKNFKVDARLVREKENTRKYKVKSTKKYKEVENQMKGVESNENDL